jgi:ketosteroid isomerase-like protein
MYKASVRALIRRSIARLNAGDAEPFLRMATDATEFTFPGDNSWSTMFRPAQGGRHAHVTHRGMAELRAFADRFVDEGIQIEIEDILVNGPPWRLRVAVRAHDYVPDHDGGPDSYANRYVGLIELRWGRIARWEVYEDTERTAARDRARRSAVG